MDNLFDRNLHNVLDRIFLRLSASDLRACEDVAVAWRDFIRHRLVHSDRWAHFVSAHEAPSHAAAVLRIARLDHRDEVEQHQRKLHEPAMTWTETVRCIHCHEDDVFAEVVAKSANRRMLVFRGGAFVGSLAVDAHESVHRVLCNRNVIVVDYISGRSTDVFCRWSLRRVNTMLNASSRRTVLVHAAEDSIRTLIRNRRQTETLDFCQLDTRRDVDCERDSASKQSPGSVRRTVSLGHKCAGLNESSFHFSAYRDHLLVACFDGIVKCFDCATMEPVWSSNCPQDNRLGRVVSARLECSDTHASVMLTGSDGASSFVLLNVITGRLVRRMFCPSSHSLAMAVGRNYLVYIVSSSDHTHRLCALTLPDSRERHTVSLRTAASVASVKILKSRVLLVHFQSGEDSDRASGQIHVFDLLAKDLAASHCVLGDLGLGPRSPSSSLLSRLSGVGSARVEANGSSVLILLNKGVPPPSEPEPGPLRTPPSKPEADPSLSPPTCQPPESEEEASPANSNCISEPSPGSFGYDVTSFSSTSTSRIAFAGANPPPPQIPSAQQSFSFGPTAEPTWAGCVIQ